MENLYKLFKLATDSNLELRIHVNPHFDNEMSIYRYIDLLLSNRTISNETAKICIDKNVIICVFLYPSKVSDKYIYSYATDIEEAAKDVLEIYEG
jgi:hypothetical protein